MIVINVLGYKGGVGKTIIVNYIAKKLEEKGYKVVINENKLADFIIYDSAFNPKEASIYIFVCELPSLKRTHELSLLINKGKRILVVNKIPPVPKDLARYLKDIDSVKKDFDKVYLVPFNGGFFKGELISEPTLDLLVEDIIGEVRIQRKVIYPFV